MELFSIPPEAKYRPSGENAKHLILSPCPYSVANSIQEAQLQRVIILFPLPEAKNLPLGENVTQ
jgi:hypothetical protein